MFQLEKETQGPCPEFEELQKPFYERVIPRLLRPLETGGRTIEPALVHGDMWFGNVSTDMKTDEPLAFDACAFYAHNEYELGTWRPERYRSGKPYIAAYHRYFPVSAPVEDHDDRNALYSIRFNMHASALYTGNTTFRTMIIDEMKRLIVKYPGGFEDWEKSQIKTSGPT